MLGQNAVFWTADVLKRKGPKRRHFDSFLICYSSKSCVLTQLKKMPRLGLSTPPLQLVQGLWRKKKKKKGKGRGKSIPFWGFAPGRRQAPCAPKLHLLQQASPGVGRGTDSSRCAALCLSTSFTTMGVLFTKTENDLVEMHHLIQPVHFSPKPLFCITNNKKFQFM